MTMPPTQFKATGPVFADAVPESGVVNLTIAAPSVNSCAQFELTPARADALAHGAQQACSKIRFKSGNPPHKAHENPGLMLTARVCLFFFS